ncbi:unnamed protein product [Tenebrio molitor]|nr:unnamed protein product [Tenebrio molitor]
MAACCKFFVVVAICVQRVYGGVQGAHAVDYYSHPKPQLNKLVFAFIPAT